MTRLYSKKTAFHSSVSLHFWATNGRYGFTKGFPIVADGFSSSWILPVFALASIGFLFIITLAISSFATIYKITPSTVYCIVQTIQVVNTPSTHNPYFEWWVYCFSSFFPLGRRRRRSALGRCWCGALKMDQIG